VKRWYCVQAKHRYEFFAAANLRRNGFEPLLLTELRTTKRKNGVEFEKLVSLFGIYFFIPLDIEVDNWKRVVYTHGVRRIFSSNPETPSPIPDSVIESLIASRNPITTTPETPQIHPGCRVRIIQGPLANPNTEAICQWRDGDRVKLLLSIVQREVMVEFHVSSLELIE